MVFRDLWLVSEHSFVKQTYDKFWKTKDAIKNVIIFSKHSKWKLEIQKPFLELTIVIITYEV